MADAEASWPVDGGNVGARLREPGFAADGLGPVAAWPAELRAAIDAILDSEKRMFVVWGPEYAFLFNDMMLRNAITLQLDGLGLGYARVFPTLWKQFAPFIERAYAGEALVFESLKVEAGHPAGGREFWVSFSYTPLRDAAGKGAGLVCVTEDWSAQMGGTDEAADSP